MLIIIIFSLILNTYNLTYINIGFYIFYLRKLKLKKLKFFQTYSFYLVFFSIKIMYFKYFVCKYYIYIIFLYDYKKIFIFIALLLLNK
jgi:hypothetical protein